MNRRLQNDDKCLALKGFCQLDQINGFGRSAKSCKNDRSSMPTDTRCGVLVKFFQTCQTFEWIKSSAKIQSQLDWVKSQDNRHAVCSILRDFRTFAVSKNGQKIGSKNVKFG